MFFFSVPGDFHFRETILSLVRKRHRGWSNSSAIGALDRGFLRKKARDSCVVKTTTKKKRADGKRTYSGNRWLKGTQPGPHQESFFADLRACRSMQKVFPCTNSKMCRSYPVAFGLKVQRILPKLLAKCSGPSPLPSEPANSHEAPAMFQQMDFGPDTWSEAKLMECCVYMRGSKHLAVPERWKSAFPTHISEDLL